MKSQNKWIHNLLFNIIETPCAVMSSTTSTSEKSKKVNSAFVLYKNETSNHKS